MLRYLYKLATDEHKGFLAGVIKFFLYPLSLIYGLIVRLLIFVYRIKPRQLDCRVISVGNITLGGTGKTSLAALIARYLKQQGHRVAILSRGYKRKVKIYDLRFTNYENMGDEPYMLAKNLGGIPVIVNKDRIKAAKQAIKAHNADTIILDDGFQQWKIEKDLEIVAIDSAKPFGNRQLIPRGILREPLSSLRRADIFILTKTNLNPDFQDIEHFLSRVNPAAQIFDSIHKPIGFYKLDNVNELLGLDVLKGKKVTLISGIGDPESFENLIAGLGINIGLSFKFPDHHQYSQKDLESIVQESQKKSIDTIITTEKDAVRLYDMRYAICDMQLLVLRIELVITNDEKGFYNRLLQLYPH